MRLQARCLKVIRKVTVSFLCIIVCTSCAATEIALPPENRNFDHSIRGIHAKQNSSVSISPFPYDLSVEALGNVNKVVSEAGGIYTVQLDNGIPWQDAIDGKDFSDDVMGDWIRHKNAIGANQVVYLAIAPLTDDRVSWASDHAGKKAPSWVRKEKKINKKLLLAYKKYLRRAVDYFQPKYLNIGVEAGDVAHKSPRKWASMEKLFNETNSMLKKEYPQIQVGISWGLPLLMQKDVLQRSQDLIDKLDYVGISFYPYMEQFYTKIGGVKLASAPAQWREPLQWLETHIAKPIAICETGYASERVVADEWGLDMQSNEQLQAQFIKELANFAQRDDYLFTVFFLAIDFHKLRRKLGIPLMKLWESTGFFDENLEPKPAWFAYQQHWLNDIVGAKSASKAEESTRGSSRPSSEATARGSRAKIINISLADKKYPFKTPGKISVDKDNSLKWKYTYSKDWSWALKELPAGTLANATSVSLKIKSDLSGPLFFQIKESSGEAFYTIFRPTAKWQSLDDAFTAFKIDASTKTDGVLNPEKVTSIMIADDAGVERGKKGKRFIEIRDLYFSR